MLTLEDYLKDILTKFKRVVFANDLHLNLEHRLLLSTSVVAIFFCIIGLFLNIIIFKSYIAIAIPALFLVVMALFYLKVRASQVSSVAILFMSIFGIFGISVMWIFNGGVNSSMELPSIIILILSLVVVSKTYKTFILLFSIGLHLILLLLSYYSPDLIVGYNGPALRHIDQGIAVVYSSLTIYLIVRYLHNNYQSARLEALRNENRLQVLIKDLQHLNNTKDKFFSIIAHDLRGPISNLYEVNKLLQSHYDTMDDKEFRDFLELSTDSSAKLFELLENLLLWARSQQGLMNIFLSDLKIKHLIVSNISLLNLKAKNKNIELINNYSGDATIKADKNLISTVFRNLLSNAIKYTLDGGVVIINVDENYSDDLILVSIADSGIGISQDRLERLFDVGEKISTDGTAGEKGTGLGLILGKEFVELNSGTIWVESRENVGTTFYFTVPKYVESMNKHL